MENKKFTKEVVENDNSWGCLSIIGMIAFVLLVPGIFAVFSTEFVGIIAAVCLFAILVLIFCKKNKTKKTLEVIDKTAEKGEYSLKKLAERFHCDVKMIEYINTLEKREGPDCGLFFDDKVIAISHKQYSCVYSVEKFYACFPCGITDKMKKIEVFLYFTRDEGEGLIRRSFSIKNCEDTERLIFELISKSILYKRWKEENWEPTYEEKDYGDFKFDKNIIQAELYGKTKKVVRNTEDIERCHVYYLLDGDVGTDRHIIRVFMKNGEILILDKYVYTKMYNPDEAFRRIIELKNCAPQMEYEIRATDDRSWF